MGTLNARIKETRIGVEGHGIFTASVTFDLEGGGTQGFGGYDLRHSDAAFKFISGILKVTGRDSWERLVGATVRVKRDGTIVAVGNLLTNDWFTADDIYGKKAA